MLRKEAARQCGNITTPKMSTMEDNRIIARNYERGSLIGGIMLAVFFGLMMIHAAVML